VYLVLAPVPSIRARGQQNTIWTTRRLIANAHMMDDWMTAVRTRPKVERNLKEMCDKLVGAGHTIQKEKNEVSQRMVYLGILIDSNRMTVSVEAVQCKGMAAQLRSYLVKIKNFRGLDGGTMRSVSGSPNWYAEVLQSGRVHARSWWLYCILFTASASTRPLRLNCFAIRTGGLTCLRGGVEGGLQDCSTLSFLLEAAGGQEPYQGLQGVARG
jgi:hypothetical protein